MSRSIGSASDRLRGAQSRHASLAEHWHDRIDKIEEAEAKAIPIIERELSDREYSVQALESDARAMTELADALEKGSNSGRPTSQSRQSAQGSEVEKPKTEQSALELISDPIQKPGEEDTPRPNGGGAG